MSSTAVMERKGHVCPPSSANHPSDRWESLFVYAFICKFTQLRGKTEGLESPMDFENALMSREPNIILSKVLERFILNLKPQTRNLSTDQISSTMAAVLSEYLKSPERTIFWNDELRANVDPLEGLEGGFFAADWDLKLKILRQLVELQLSHGPEIKATIDRAWGVVHNKHKKDMPQPPPLDPSDPKSRERLQFMPMGQDSQRKRYWVADDSPRVYISTNPWKITATFQTVASSREEYVGTIEQLKATAPPELKKGQKRTKLETAHLGLISALESRLEKIDAELARVQRVRRKFEQRQALLAQAELRETRTRRRARRPDYTEPQEFEENSQDDTDYRYQEDVDDEEFHDPMAHRTAAVGTRRSARTNGTNGTKRDASPDAWNEWRGERRSSRLGAPAETQFDCEPPPKRARTEDSTTSSNSADGQPPQNTNKASARSAGAAALKPTEIAVDKLPGKKASRFWVYAVEPIPGTAPPSSGSEMDSANEGSQPTSTDHSPASDRYPDSGNKPSHNYNKMDYNRSLEGSLPSMDST